MDYLYLVQEISDRRCCISLPLLASFQNQYRTNTLSKAFLPALLDPPVAFRSGCITILPNHILWNQNLLRHLICKENDPVGQGFPCWWLWAFPAYFLSISSLSVVHFYYTILWDYGTSLSTDPIIKNVRILYPNTFNFPTAHMPTPDVSATISLRKVHHWMKYDMPSDLAAYRLYHTKLPSFHHFMMNSVMNSPQIVPFGARFYNHKNLPVTLMIFVVSAIRLEQMTLWA